MISCWKKRRLRFGLQIILCNMQAPPTSEQLQYCSPFGGHPEGHCKGEWSLRQNVAQCTWSFTLFERRNDQTCDCISTPRLWPMAWLNHQGLGWNVIGKFVTRKLGEDLWDRTLRMDKKYEGICVPRKRSQRVTSVEEDF